MVKIAGLDSNNEFEAESVKDHIKNLAASAVDVSGLANQVSGAVTHQTVADRLDVDLGISVNEISEVTGPTDVYFKDVTTADGRTNPDGMGTLLIVEKGAEFLTWPGGTRVHGRPSVNSESFASLVRVSGVVHVIWSASDSTPPPVSGTDSGTVLASLSDVLLGKVLLAPGASVLTSDSGSFADRWRFTNLNNTPSTDLTLVNGVARCKYNVAAGGHLTAMWAPRAAAQTVVSLPKPEVGVDPEPGSGWVIAVGTSTVTDAGWEYIQELAALIPGTSVRSYDPEDYSSPPAVILPYSSTDDNWNINQFVVEYRVETEGSDFRETSTNMILRQRTDEELEEYGISFVFEYLSPERLSKYPGITL